MTEVRPIRVLLVDDHVVVRKGLVYVLSNEPDIALVGEAENGEEALYLCRKLKPHIVIMDYKMKGVGGLDATKLIVQHHPAVHTIGLSTFANSDVINAMYEAGAKGCLLKDISGAQLLSAIRRVHSGELLPYQDNLTSSVELVEMAPTIESDESFDALGEQQQKVLALLTKGFTNPEIAKKLDISNSTARYHVSAILRKLDVSNRSEAVAVAVRFKLVSGVDF